jgi:hypothetical protein
MFPKRHLLFPDYRRRDLREPYRLAKLAKLLHGPEGELQPALE